MIEIDSVSKKFGKLQVLNQVNLTLERGECVALIGPNGCGKTTLIKSILGMVLPDSGTIVIGGKSIQNDFLYREKIGYMPQIGKYPVNMTINQIVLMIKSIRNTNQPLDEELYVDFGIDSLKHKKMGTLSGGTTQKVSATLAFLFNPDVLILDEPTAGLDPLAAEILKQKIIKEKEKGKLIIITSHLLSELDELVDHIVFMQEGKLMFHKSVEDLKIDTGTDKTSKAIIHILKN